MRKLLVPGLSLFLCMASALADDIAVYRGTWRFTTDAQGATIFPQTFKAYFIVNYTTGETSQLVYFSKNGKKIVSAGGPMDTTRATLPNGKTATVFASGSTSKTSATDFGYTSFFYRGTDILLLVETSPARRTIQRPRSFVATYHDLQANPDDPSTLQAATMSFSLDAAKTIAANNADKAFATVVTEIQQGLVSQGYTPLN